jgi:hypothetical protein
MEPVAVERRFGRSAVAGRFVGVVPPLCFQTLSMPKRLLLMFDQLALDLGGAPLTLVERRIIDRARAEMETGASAAIEIAMPAGRARFHCPLGRGSRGGFFGIVHLLPVLNL